MKLTLTMISIVDALENISIFNQKYLLEPDVSTITSFHHGWKDEIFVITRHLVSSSSSSSHFIRSYDYLYLPMLIEDDDGVAAKREIVQPVLVERKIKNATPNVTVNVIPTRKSRISYITKYKPLFLSTICFNCCENIFNGASYQLLSVINHSPQQITGIYI
ncbi:hypothetical protein DFA_11194 [Cavenderia fasciculata]|uniref:Uncharacterized protein n=1 Tax=Cavenderia fasciculata TaxID=261658 RepID=F4QFC6_CACFS|nr:uncharacterized protein DFA_11194 [Cavenderia fasciculata]EGG13433.1 hypothetical protein DFA_11194 [Cavenderia fasciculata]|eukprot:XP_004350137.1 hypothetical protein DFA_11194 [Cavenderia fasciculata]